MRRPYTIYVGYVSDEARKRADSLRSRASRLRTNTVNDLFVYFILLERAREAEEDEVSWRLLRRHGVAGKVVEFTTRRKVMARIRKLHAQGHSYLRIARPDGEIEIVVTCRRCSVNVGKPKTKTQ